MVEIDQYQIDLDQCQACDSKNFDKVMGILKINRTKKKLDKNKNKKKVKIRKKQKQK